MHPKSASFTHDFSLALTKECEFETAIQEQIHQLWLQVQTKVQIARDGKQLTWCKLTNENHTKAIVLINGRVESFCKYQELFFDLYQQGYDVYSFDHRGQGLSERLTNNLDIGYVEQFDDYIHDLADLIKCFSLDHYQQRFLLAHSMGGAITARYLQKYQPQQFQAAALTAPMMGIEVPTIVRPIAAPLMYAMSKLSSQPQYAPGHKAYYLKPFENNPLTQSSVRYHWFRQLYEEIPELQLGGPSTHWVWQSLKATQDIYANAKDIPLPLLVIQASEEKIVSNTAQIRFMRRLASSRKDCVLKIIYGAQHELLFEQDNYRQETLNTILNFFTRHQ
ncbi:alpha/beta fold hydrolase [Vibrio sp. FNV 38]|nr:alpha/beta fold hydrolase [Vibrio sp. FNV 38]